MRKSIIIIFALFCFVSTYGQTRWNQRYQDYVDNYKDIAIREMLSYNIPASITLAQGLLESGGGTSSLTREGNNHFGIKCHGWKGRTIYKDDDAKNECFRAYDTPLESFEDHSRFLASSQRYRSLFSLNRNDYRGWAYGLKKAGYATNPIYAQQLIDLIEVYKLSQYDRATSYNRSNIKEPKRKHDNRGNGTSILQPNYEIRSYNHNYFVVAHAGDTFANIGAAVGKSPKKLARFNERDLKSTLNEGEIVWLKKKRTRADKQYKGQFIKVMPGESMYSIAQRYGITVKSLYKKNYLAPDYRIQAGDLLLVY